MKIEHFMTWAQALLNLSNFEVARKKVEQAIDHIWDKVNCFIFELNLEFILKREKYFQFHLQIWHFFKCNLSYIKRRKKYP